MVYMVKAGETVRSIAKDFRISPEALAKANGLTVQSALSPGRKLLVPGLRDPNTIPYRIAVSISKKKLGLYRNGTLVKQYPIATGRMLYSTPIGEFVIVNREPNPGGPYGAMWLSLSKAGYGIHGTNNPASIGQSVSKGCIRMYNKDVLELAAAVPNGTRVSIIS
ncbi:L,D-transpeptidase family protein [Metabacillus sp. KIGAM252]|uniref:L,D-transpeptidase family protein n=1 Tax=Metabacillus flavus TaxID=2823519 RepID=A0ABS5LD73_9BACI|nr:L,D-transpeptidase family protein [Metabacillus flavus]MBS2968647.1 L,D-transpeptidase family protein [Metabacillus flavus]